MLVLRAPNPQWGTVQSKGLRTSVGAWVVALGGLTVGPVGLWTHHLSACPQGIDNRKRLLVSRTGDSVVAK